MFTGFVYRLSHAKNRKNRCASQGASGAVASSEMAGGDSDTIAAIAGGIAEAYFGVPEEYIERARTILDKRLLLIYDDFRKWLEERAACIRKNA